MILPKQLEHAGHAEHMQNLFEFFQKRLSLDKTEILPRVSQSLRVVSKSLLTPGWWLVVDLYSPSSITPGSRKRLGNIGNRKTFLKIGWLIAMDCARFVATGRDWTGVHCSCNLHVIHVKIKSKQWDATAFAIYSRTSVILLWCSFLSAPFQITVDAPI